MTVKQKIKTTLAILPLTMYGELDNNLTPFLKSLKGNTLPRFGPMKAYLCSPMLHFTFICQSI
jgi:hypothetical protein